MARRTDLKKFVIIRLCFQVAAVFDCLLESGGLWCECHVWDGCVIGMVENRRTLERWVLCEISFSRINSTMEGLMTWGRRRGKEPQLARWRLVQTTALAIFASVCLFVSCVSVTGSHIQAQPIEGSVAAIPCTMACVSASSLRDIAGRKGYIVSFRLPAQYILRGTMSQTRAK